MEAQGRLATMGFEVGMIENQKIRPAQVIGPLGEPLTLDSLPAPSTSRWVVRRKAEVVAAVNGGLLSVDEACERGRPFRNAGPARDSNPALQIALRAPAEILNPPLLRRGGA
jgi:hypothetical protein